PASDRAVSRDRPALEPAGVPEGLRMQGGRPDGAVRRQTLRGLVEVVGERFPAIRRRAGRPTSETRNSGLGNRQPRAADFRHRVFSFGNITFWGAALSRSRILRVRT